MLSWMQGLLSIWRFIQWRAYGADPLSWQASWTTACATAAPTGKLSTGIQDPMGPLIPLRRWLSKKKHQMRAWKLTSSASVMMTVRIWLDIVGSALWNLLQDQCTAHAVRPSKLRSIGHRHCSPMEAPDKRDQTKKELPNTERNTELHTLAFAASATRETRERG